MNWTSEDILYQPIVRKHLSLNLVGYSLGILFYIFVDAQDFEFSIELILSGFLGICLAYLAHFLSKVLNDLMSWETQPGVRLFVGVLSHLALGMLVSFLGIWIYSKLFLETTFFELDEHSILLKIEILLFFTALIYNVFYFTFYSYEQYARGQISKQKYERKQQELQFQALKSQLSPHFLFNSMNVVSSLIHKNTLAAEEFIRGLAQSYQYVFNKYGNSLVSMKDEVGFLQSYASLMKIRFGNAFTLDIDLSKATFDTKIPPMTLQILVENAIKHNRIDIDAPLAVQVYEKEGAICVHNNKSLKKNNPESTRLGLKNITDRYRLIANEEVEIINNDAFQVLLPILK